MATEFNQAQELEIFERNQRGGQTVQLCERDRGTTDRVHLMFDALREG